MNSAQKYQAKLERKKRKKFIKETITKIQNTFPGAYGYFVRNIANDIYFINSKEVVSYESSFFGRLLIRELIIEGPPHQAIILSYQGLLGCNLDQVKVAADIAYESGLKEFGDACIAADRDDLLYIYNKLFPLHCVKCQAPNNCFCQKGYVERLYSDAVLDLKNKPQSERELWNVVR